MGQLQLPELAQMQVYKPQGSVARGKAGGMGGGNLPRSGGNLPRASAPSVHASIPSSGGGGGRLLKALLGINGGDNQPDPQVQQLRDLQIQKAQQELSQDQELFPLRKQAAEQTVKKNEQDLHNNLIDQSIKETQNKEEALKAYAQKATIGGLAAAQVEALPEEKRAEYYQTHLDMFKSIDDKAPDTYDKKYMQNMIGIASSVGAQLKVDPNLASLAFNDEDRAAMKQVFQNMQAKDEFKAQSDIGKVVADKMALQDRGMKSDAPEMKALDDKLSGLNKGDANKNEDTLRGSYLNESKDYQQQTSAYSRIQSFKGEDMDNNPSADTALLFSYMKLINPTAMVREGSIASAEEARGIPDKIIDMYNNAVSGDRLAPKQREQLITAAEQAYKGAKAQHDQLIGEYGRIAKNMGANPDNVIVNLDYKAPQQEQAPKIDVSNITDDQIGQKAQQIASQYGLSPDQARAEVIKQIQGLKSQSQQQPQDLTQQGNQ